MNDKKLDTDDDLTFDDLVENDKQNKARKTKLTTSIGKLLDRASYKHIGLAILSIILFSSIYFFAFNAIGIGTNKKDLGFGDALYFSIITFSSLGYGDIAPVGLGKLVAALEVLSGLMLVALFVGKLASERQATLLLLIYTSENQRRIAKFIEDINEFEDKMDNALTNHDHEKLLYNAKQSYKFIAALFVYLRFQADEGGLALYGNASSLRKLYEAISEFQLRAYEALRTQSISPQLQTKLEQLLRKIGGIASGMAKFHANDIKILLILSNISEMADIAERWTTKHLNGEAHQENRTTITDDLIERVKASLPPEPWDQSTHKILAAKLNINKALARRCIDKIVADRN